MVEFPDQYFTFIISFLQATINAYLILLLVIIVTTEEEQYKA
jgi:hypothetical protein